MNKQLNLITAFLLFSFCVVLLYGCSGNVKKEKEAILLADREAPLGWISLRIYKDSTFEFISSGIRSKDRMVYPGVVSLHKDTLKFNYKDAVPEAGSTAVIKNKFVIYTDGSYPEAVVVKLNKLE